MYNGGVVMWDGVEHSRLCLSVPRGILWVAIGGNMNPAKQVALELLDAAKTLLESDPATAAWYISLAERLLQD